MKTCDDLGDRIKGYENRETERIALNRVPLIVRIDGRCFHSFTKGMDRPFDEKFCDTMICITKKLVDEFNAKIGYTQSDEITLVFYSEDVKSEQIFGGRIFKITSILAATATAFFLQRAYGLWPEKCINRPPTFDARVFEVPNKMEAVNTLLWRELDATKNAISMAARAYLSHKELQNKNGSEMQEMLFQKGINFNDYKPKFKRGTFIGRKEIIKELDADILNKIPANKRPTEPILRSIVTELELPQLNKIANPVEVLFDNVEPILKT